MRSRNTRKASLLAFAGAVLATLVLATPTAATAAGVTPSPTPPSPSVEPLASNPLDLSDPAVAAHDEKLRAEGADIIASGKDAPLYSEGLGEGPYLEGDPALETEVRYYAPTFSKNPLSVTVVDECHSTEFLC